MQCTADRPTVKTAAPALRARNRCRDCGNPFESCDCRWELGPGQSRKRPSLIRRAGGSIRVLSNSYLLTIVRVTTGKVARTMTLVPGRSARVWLIESKPEPTATNPYPRASFYAVDIEDGDCECPDSQRRVRAGIPVDSPLRGCKHVNVVKALLARSEANAATV